MWTRHLLQAHSAFHCCLIHKEGIKSHGGRPVCSLQLASASGRHMKHPRAGRPGFHPSRGEPGGQVSHVA
eukprot:6851227-Pyramimonas_sp.AAC.1